MNGMSALRRATRQIIFVPLCVMLVSCSSSPAQPGLAEDTVTIQRDSWGVPHIYAATEAGGWFGLGYAQAEDRLELILGLPRWAQGHAAEITGDAALPVDIEMRRWRHRQEAEAGLKHLSPQLLENYRAYVAGIRRYMAQHPERVPSWAGQPEVIDYLAMTRAAFWAGYIGRLGAAECEKGGAELSAAQRAVHVELAAQAGIVASNGWAVMPSRTDDGSTMLLADPHVEVNSPMYYEFRMHAGDINTAGFAMGPVQWQIHNRHVGWAMTTGNPDMWDCYRVKRAATGSDSYRYDGELRQLERYTEVFKSASGKRVEQTFLYSRHNSVLSPVVAGTPDEFYVVSTSWMHDTGRFDEEIYRMSKAQSVAEVKQVLTGLGTAPQNLIVADTGGHLWYLRAGKTPRRPEGSYDWLGAVPGNSSATAWRGYHTLNEHVQLDDPADGWLQNNNVSPAAMYPDGRLRAEDYPAALYNADPTHNTSRGMRAIQVLSAATDFSIDDALALAFDEYWVTTPTWQAALRAAAKHLPGVFAALSPEAKAMHDRLLAFDGFAHRESVAALDMNFWVAAAADQIIRRPELDRWRQWPWHMEAMPYQLQALLLAELETAVQDKIAATGGLDQPLGAYYRAGRSRAVPLGGSTLLAKNASDCVSEQIAVCDRTLRAFRFTPARDGIRRQKLGSQSMRLMHFTKDGVDSQTLHAFGQNENPQHQHYDDQAELAGAKRMKPSWFNRSDWSGLEAGIIELQMTEEIERQ